MLPRLDQKAITGFYQLSRGEHGKAVLAALEEELKRTQNALVEAQGVELIARLQGRAQCLQNILATASGAEGVLKPQGSLPLS